MARRKAKFDYFEAYERQAEIACREADVLARAIQEFTTADDLREIMEEAHRIEQEGDDANHSVLRSVAVDFITPIDREDVIDLAQRLDTVVDNIEGVIQCLYMYDVHSIHEFALELVELIQKSTRALHVAMGDFRNFKRSDNFRNLLEEVNTYEEEADRLYLKATRMLYTEERENEMRVLVWSRLFDRMEACCDACEHVADTMNDILLKNM